MRRFIPSTLWQISRSAPHYYHTRPVVMDPLVVIYGSTGTGKSDLAVELATRFNGEIINADAMQMYKGLPIITNKLTEEEQRGIPHHLLGNIDLETEPWTVRDFKPKAIQIISEIRARGKLPIVVGGTSYYLDSLIFEEKLANQGHLPDSAENEKKHPILLESAEVMLAKLREVDPIMADRWHPKDIRKIRNSLEFYLVTGRRASDVYAEQRSRKESKWASTDSAAAIESDAQTSPWKAIIFWLYSKKDALDARLEKRVDRMVDNGLLSEVTEVYDYLQGRLATGEEVDRTKGIWQSIGFKQFEPYLCALKDKEHPTPPHQLAKLKEAGIEETKIANRQYAKYQVRWIGTKTIAALEENKALDKLFLLDSSDIGSFQSEVLEKGAELTQKFLTDQALPQPSEVSETAREVLTAQTERRNRLAAVVPCNKTCELCDMQFVTEDTWGKHINSNRHRAKARGKKRRALVVVPDGDNAEETSPTEIAARQNQG